MPALVEVAVELLRKSSELTALTTAEARRVASHMRLVSYPAGATVMREGDQVHTGYMLLCSPGARGTTTTRSSDRSGRLPRRAPAAASVGAAACRTGAPAPVSIAHGLIQHFAELR